MLTTHKLCERSCSDSREKFRWWFYHGYFSDSQCVQLSRSVTKLGHQQVKLIFSWCSFTRSSRCWECITRKHNLAWGDFSNLHWLDHRCQSWWRYWYIRAGWNFSGRQSPEHAYRTDGQESRFSLNQSCRTRSHQTNHLANQRRKLTRSAATKLNVNRRAIESSPSDVATSLTEARNWSRSSEREVISF